MDIGKAALVIGITLIAVILFNVMLYLSITRRRESSSEFHLMTRAAKRARNPWINEDNDLAELSRRVVSLRNREFSEGETPSPAAGEQKHEH